MFTDLRDDLDSEFLLSGFDHWVALDGDAPVPKRESLDPSALPPALLPHIVMLEVQTEPLDFRYRIIGDHALRNFSRNHTGSWMSEIPHQGCASKLFKTLAQVVETREPLYSRISFADPDMCYLMNSEIILPLCNTSGDIARLLIFVDCASEAETEGKLAG